MAIQLPSNAAGAGGSSSKNVVTAPLPDEEVLDQTLFEEMFSVADSGISTIVDTATQVKKAFTGEDVEIEFPEIPEITQNQDAGFFETFIPNAKIMMARDDFGKAEIIANSFKGDSRFGGTFVDKFDNPMIVWNKQPYYINKPGFSTQDFGTMLGEMAKFIPATKIVGGAKNLAGTVGRGLGLYPTTEVAGQTIEAVMTPKTTKARGGTITEQAQDVGVATGIGVAADVVAPPVAKVIGRGLKSAATGTGRAVSDMFPRFDPESPLFSSLDDVTQSSTYPLTQGQRTSPLPDRKAGTGSKVTPQLEAEDIVRNAPSTNVTANQIVRGFDDNQLSAIRDDAQALSEEFGSGDVGVRTAADVPTAAAETIQSTVGGAAQSLKSRSGAAYDVVKTAEFQPVMTREGVVETSQSALDSVLKGSDAITARELGDMPILKRELDYLKRINKVASNPRFKGQPLSVLHGYQKSLNRAVRTAEAGSPESLALGRIKSQIDQAVFDGIETGIITGDQAVLDSLKEATGLYRQYIGLTGKGTGRDSQERAANRILEMITNPNYTPKQVVNAFFGHAKFNPNQSMGLVLDKLRANLPEDQFQEVVALAKDGVLEKAFSGTGRSGVTRTNIVNNYDDIFVKNKAIVSKLFSEDEIARISQFRENVMPTLWAEIKLNPPGTAYLVLSGMARSGLLNYARLIPFVGKDAVEAVEGIGAVNQAKAMVSQYLNRTNQPLFSNVMQSQVRPTIVEGEPEGPATISGDSPALKSIVKDAPSELLNKLRANQ
jgi:hypothetical protein